MTQFTAKPHIRMRGGEMIVEYRVPAAKAGVTTFPWQSPVTSNFLGLIQESFPGAWQRNITEASPQNALSFCAYYACITLIAADVSKLRLMITEKQSDGTWMEVENGPLLPVLRKPNSYQTRAQFLKDWVTSKLMYGNTYVLKEYDNRGGENQGVVMAEHVLNPASTQVLVAENGEVFYRVGKDNLAHIDEEGGIVIPASDIIHDRMNCFWHPLVGVSPIYACGRAIQQGLAIQTNSTQFFENMSRPSGLLTSPGQIGDDTAKKWKEAWENSFQRGNMGRLAVLGGGLKYEPMTIPANDSQLIEQLKLSAEWVAMTFHVPPHKINLATGTGYKPADRNQEYYDDCIHDLLESFEQLMDEALELPVFRRTEFDTSGFLRLDPLGQAQTNAVRLGSGELAPNEARRAQGLPPVDGGEAPLIQQQNYSLPALAKRDAKPDPFAKDPAPPTAKEIADELADKVLPTIADAKRVATEANENAIKAQEFVEARIAGIEEKIVGIQIPDYSAQFAELVKQMELAPKAEDIAELTRKEPSEEVEAKELADALISRFVQEMAEND